MRCPKCQYIGFDNGDRCRNCGYEFSLAVDAGALDLPIQTGNEPLGPLSDFPLTDLDTPETPGAAPPSRTPAAFQEPESGRASASKAPLTGSLELPLFKRPVDDEAPLVSAPAVPRPPLAVRRSSPVPPRAPAPAHADEPELDLGLPEPGRLRMPSGRRREAAAAARTPVPPDGGDAGGMAAGAGPRIGAALLDGALLAAINLAVLYFTLRLTGLTFAELRVLPPVPLFGFLLLLTGAYFVAFTTAGGQTIGKMAAGIRVVSAGSPDERPGSVPLGHAVVRAAAYAVSLLPAGLGYLPALVGHDRRAIHDRLADTRVVKA